ncbi:hypothetical protein Hanom_Chr16g01501841 [Helianthus anomalus]
MTDVRFPQIFANICGIFSVRNVRCHYQVVNRVFVLSINRSYLLEIYSSQIFTAKKSVFYIYVAVNKEQHNKLLQYHSPPTFYNIHKQKHTRGRYQTSVEAPTASLLLSLQQSMREKRTFAPSKLIQNKIVCFHCLQ